MRLIFSKNRPAQLDLLLRSLDRYAPPGDEVTAAIWTATTPAFVEGYRRVLFSPPTPPDEFDADLRSLLEDDETVTFFCDDDVVFRRIPAAPTWSLRREKVLCHSWRLGDLPGVRPRTLEAGRFHETWDWTILPRTDHGYPGSIDGHTFRTSDVQEMIGHEVIANPTMLETVLALGCERLADRRPLMAAWPEQVLVGVPVNRVSEQSGCPNGERFPQPVEELNRRFLAGERIALDRLDFSGVAGCHHEIQYEWE